MRANVRHPPAFALTCERRKHTRTASGVHANTWAVLAQSHRAQKEQIRGTVSRRRQIVDAGRARTRGRCYQPSTFAKMRGATIVASDSIRNLGVSTPSLPQVIFSLGTAPE